MKTSTKIVIAAAVAAALIGGTSVAVVAASHKTAEKPAGISRSATATLPPHQTSTPSATPSATPVADNGAGDGEGLNDPAMPLIANVRGFRDVAEAGVIAYMTLTPDESDAARQPGWRRTSQPGQSSSPKHRR